MSPRVSICVPAYQAGTNLAETLASVWRQDFTDFELVLVDDGSTDATPEVVAAQDDPRLRAFRRERNRGQAVTVAETIARARGELVKFLDSDDLLHPDCVGKMVAGLDAHPEAVLAFSRRDVMAEEPDDPASLRWVEEFGTLHHRFEELEAVNDGRDLLRQYLHALLPGNWIAEPAGVMARRADLLAVGGYNRKVRQSNDMDMWARLMVRGSVVFIDEPLFTYRLAFTGVTGGSTSTSAHWLDSLWIAEGLGQMRGFPEPEALAVARRRATVRLLRRLARSPLREPGSSRARAADFVDYAGYRLVERSGRAKPLHEPYPSF